MDSKDWLSFGLGIMVGVWVTDLFFFVVLRL